jgi:hypothetical protein
MCLILIFNIFCFLIFNSKKPSRANARLAHPPDGLGPSAGTNVGNFNADVNKRNRASKILAVMSPAVKMAGIRLNVLQRQEKVGFYLHTTI